MRKQQTIVRPTRRDLLRMGVTGAAGLIAAQFAFPKVLLASGSYSGQVSASTDDASDYDLTGAYVIFKKETAGFRFTNVTVPQGATISSAYFSVYNSSNRYVDPAFNICAEKIGNSPTFSSTNGPQDRTYTVNYVAVDAPPSDGPCWWSSPDFSAVIQEVVNLSGWASGNALSIILQENQYFSGGFRIEMYDGDSSEAMMLFITY